MGPRLGIDLSMRPELKQLLAPRMIQSMEILQLPIMELQARINQELEENPTLEKLEIEAPELEQNDRSEREPDPEGELIIQDNAEIDFNRLEQFTRDWEEQTSENHAPSRNGIEDENDRKHDAMSNMPSRPETLQDHLLEQLGYLDLSEEEDQLIRYLISHIDPKGWLGIYEAKEDDKGKLHGGWRPVQLRELVPHAPIPTDEHTLEAVLTQLQQLDPPGVGARDLRECLLLQLTDETPMAELVATLIRHHLEDIQHNRLPVIQKHTGQDIAVIKEAIEQLKRLDPRPGSRFEGTGNHYIVPDIIVESKENGELEVRLADDWIPEIRISAQYIEMCKNRAADPRTKEYLKHKIQSAQWLMESIEQRRNTLIRVTKAIIAHQKAFFERGPEAIAPLKMQDIADEVKVHVTTISRAVDDKWMQTPRGVFALRRFFGGGKQNELTGEDVALEVIKQKLLELIQNEDKSEPLSDEDLVKALNKAGYPVARRTVTKYRKALNIPSSRQRKDWLLPSPSSNGTHSSAHAKKAGRNGKGKSSH